MNTDLPESEFEQRTRELLNSRVEELSGHVRSRLTQARYAALAEARASRRSSVWQRWIPVGAAASLVLLALVFTGQHVGTPAPVAAVTSPVDDLELLADSDALDLTQDQAPLTGPAPDFDFYEWAAGEAGAPDSGAAGT